MTFPWHRGNWRPAGYLAALALLAGGQNASADLVVPAGATYALAGGTTDLACTDIVVGGTLDLGGGTILNVRNVTLSAGGAVSLGSGSITLAGNWANTGGTLAAGTGAVNFVDAATCAATSVISGNTTFYTLGITSSEGKLYQFTAGSSQTVQNLTLSGTAAQPLRIESTTPASPSADINLLASGTQSLSNLAVRGMTASGQWLAAGQTNQAAGGAVLRWFGSGSDAVAAVPTLSELSLLATVAALAALGGRRQRRRLNKNPKPARSPE